MSCILKLQKYFEIQEKKIELQSNCFRLNKNHLLMSFKIYIDCKTKMKKDFISKSNLITLDSDDLI